MFKIPNHLTKEFKSLDATKREEFIRSYRAWFNHDFTEAFIKDLQEKLDQSVLQEDRKSEFSTWFEFKSHAIKKKQERVILRAIINQLTPEV